MILCSPDVVAAAFKNGSSTMSQYNFVTVRWCAGQDALFLPVRMKYQQRRRACASKLSSFGVFASGAPSTALKTLAAVSSSRTTESMNCSTGRRLFMAHDSYPFETGGPHL